MELQCNQSEADTIMFSLYYIIRSNGLYEPVVLDLSDTDCYVQAAALSHILPGLLAIKRKSQLISCHSLCSSQIAKIIVQLHAMTGNDSNNGFYGHGKRSIYEKICKNKKFRNMLQQVGKLLPLQQNVLDLMKLFVIQQEQQEQKSGRL